MAKTLFPYLRLGTADIDCMQGIKETVSTTAIEFKEKMRISFDPADDHITFVARRIVDVNASDPWVWHTSAMEGNLAAHCACFLAGHIPRDKESADDSHEDHVVCGRISSCDPSVPNI